MFNKMQLLWMRLLYWFSDKSILVYDSSADFCLLALCSATLLDSLVPRVFGGIFGVWHNILPAADTVSLSSSLPIWMPPFSSSYLIALARTSSSMMSKSVESGILVLDHISEKAALNFFSIVTHTFNMLRPIHSFYTHFPEVIFLIIKWHWIVF